MAVAHNWGQAGQQTPRDPNKPLIVFSGSYGQHQTWRLAILGPPERANLSRVTQTLHCLALKLQKTCVNLLWRRQTSSSCQRDEGKTQEQLRFSAASATETETSMWKRHGATWRSRDCTNPRTAVKLKRSGKLTTSRSRCVLLSGLNFPLYDGQRHTHTPSHKYTWLRL